MQQDTMKGQGWNIQTPEQAATAVTDLDTFFQNKGLYAQDPALQGGIDTIKGSLGRYREQGGNTD